MVELIPPLASTVAPSRLMTLSQFVCLTTFSAQVRNVLLSAGPGNVLIPVSKFVRCTHMSFFLSVVFSSSEFRPHRRFGNSEETATFEWSEQTARNFQTRREHPPDVREDVRPEHEIISSKEALISKPAGKSSSPGRSLEAFPWLFRRVPLSVAKLRDECGCRRGLVAERALFRNIPWRPYHSSESSRECLVSTRSQETSRSQNSDWLLIPRGTLWQNGSFPCFWKL